jgi:hypothetical protein
MGLKFNPPPGWPLPWDFEPPPGWEPDPAWPAPPPGWPFWIGSGAPKVLYQVPAESAYVPGYMRESLQPEPAAGRRRPSRWRSAMWRLRRRRARRKGGHRRRRSASATGRRVALAVVGLAAIGFIAFALFGAGVKDPSQATTASTARHGRHVDLLALRTGACFQDPAKGRLIGGSAANVTALPCTLAHNAQIFARFPAHGLKYPGQTALRRQGRQHCRSALSTELDRSRLSPGTSVIDVVPSRARWAADLRTISCVVEDPAARWTKSLLKPHYGRKLWRHKHARGSSQGSARGHHSASKAAGTARRRGPRR